MPSTPYRLTGDNMSLAAITPPNIMRAAHLANAIYRSPEARKVGQFMMKNRGKFKIAATRMRQYKNARNFGMPRDTTNAKKEAMATDDTLSYGTRAIKTWDVTNIAKTTIDIANNLANTDLEVNKINRRQRQVVNVSGCKVSLQILNRATRPLTFNYAIIAPKNSTAIPSIDGFFRDYNQSRDVNFSTGLSNNEIHNNPISTDKFHVLMHRRYTIAGAEIPDNYNSKGPHNWITPKSYTKMHRQVRFNDDTGTAAEEKVFLVFWADQLFASGGSAPVADAFSMSAKIETYFNEVPVKY